VVVLISEQNFNTTKVSTYAVFFSVYVCCWLRKAWEWGYYCWLSPSNLPCTRL